MRRHLITSTVVLACLAACSSESDLQLSQPAAIVTTTTSASTTTSPTTTSTAPTTSTTESLDDRRGLDEDESRAFHAVFKETDIPPDWTECCPPLFATEAELADATLCGAPTQPPALARFQRVFAYRQAPDGSMLGRMIVSATVNSSEEAARINLAAVGTPEYAACTIESQLDDVRFLYQDHDAPGEATHEQTALGVGEQGNIDWIVADVHPHGEWIQTHAALVRFRAGDITYRLQFEMVRDHALDAATVEAFAADLLALS